jgi:ceramide glucosyltransferase
MVNVIGIILLVIAAIGTLSSTIVLVMSLVAAAKWKRDLAQGKWPPLVVPPGVSVLKPVHGLEPRLRENLESYFKQDYPRYELLFCARTRDDAALQIVDELVAQYPQVDVHILTCGEPPAANAKVHSLATMFEVAKYPIMIFSDSDVYAAPHYIHDVSLPLNDRRVGVANCLYRGVPLGGVWSLLDALGMTVEMPAGALMARMLEGVKFALGPTLATRRDVIEKIGGLRQFADYCAEDFEIGRLADAAGYRVLLSSHVIDHMAVAGDFKKCFAHQVRWMLSTRFSRPKGHFGTVFTFAAPFGVVGLLAGFLLGKPDLGLMLLLWSWANRTLQSVGIGYATLDDLLSLQFAWLYWVRDLQGFVVWCASYLGDEVIWRGQRYRLVAGGKMQRVV